MGNALFQGLPAPEPLNRFLKMWISQLKGVFLRLCEVVIQGRLCHIFIFILFNELISQHTIINISHNNMTGDDQMANI